jgi:DNA polymerase-4
VIAGGTGGRAVAWDVSPEAIRQQIKPGMALSAVQRLVKDLTVLAPNPAAYQKANKAIETVISRFAPAWQNDGCGNLYLDITGTRNLFGPPTDCICHIQNEIIDSLGIGAAAAAATNKLVSKVASRAIRPVGLIEVRPGNESAFLAHQNIALLPGMGPSLMRTVAVTGFKEIGEIAALADGEAAALFGKQGIALRDSALGIDNSPVAGMGQKRIEKKADFSEDVIDEEIILGALASLVEYGGLEMRRDRLGASTVSLATIYNDGVEVCGKEKRKRLFVLDKDILAAANRIFQKSANRRIRVSSICLSLEDMAPLGYEPDLFEMLNETKEIRLQEAIDLIQGRYGAGAVMRGIVLAASAMRTGKQLLNGPAAYG